MDTLLTRVVAGVLIVVGVIHVMPAIGVMGAAKLQSLYGLPVTAQSMEELLLRHRALLFGLLGMGLIAAAFKPSLHGVAIAWAVVSVAGFLWLARTCASPSAAVSRVIAVDAVALMALLVAATLHGWRLLR